MRHVHMRGRPSFTINHKDLLSVFDEHLLDESELTRRIRDQIDQETTQWKQLELNQEGRPVGNTSNINEDLRVYGPHEIVKVFLSSSGFDFDRLKYEEELGACIAEYMRNKRSEFKVLRQLRIKGRRIGYKGWMNICQELPYFVDRNLILEIDLRGGRIGDDGIETLCNLLKDNRSLYLLDLGACFCADKGAFAIANLLKSSSSLQILDLRWNKVGVAATSLADAFSSNDSLVVFNMRVNQPTFSGANAILQTILNKDDSKVSGIDLRECKVDFGHTFKVLSEESTKQGKADEINRSLSVDLCGNGLDSTSAAFIGQVLSRYNFSSSWYITRFMLDYNNIGSIGLQYLSKALSTNETLVVLTLARNGIGSAGAIALAEALRSNSTLTHLDLHKNPIGNLGVYALSDVLTEKNQTLSYLNLKYTDCTDFGAVSLAKAICQNESLSFLDLSKNNIGQVGGVALARALEHNVTLSRLVLDETNVGDSTFRVLSRHFANQDSYHVRLELERSNIRGAGLKQMSLETNLLDYVSHLILGSNHLGSDNIVPVHTELKDWLKTLHYNSPMMSLLRNQIFSSQTLSFVELQNNNIGDRGVELLFSSGSLPNVMFLNLGSNNITEQGAMHMSNVLSNSASNQLIGLNLSHNKLGDEGAQYIANVLKSSITLTHLKLQNNDITCIGATHLSRALRSASYRSVLDYLDLEKNMIADEGAIQIGKCVAESSSLSFVTLERNSLITQSGAAQFYQNGAKILSDPESEIISMTQLSV